MPLYAWLTQALSSALLTSAAEAEAASSLVSAAAAAEPLARTADAPASDDTHAAQRARMQAYLARRPSEPAGPAAVRGSLPSAYVRHLWFGGMRRSAAWLLAAILAVVLLRGARARAPAAWARVAWQRVVETLRMYVGHAPH